MEKKKQDLIIIKLNDYMKEKGIRNNFIAKQLGCSTSQLSKWLHGTTPRMAWTERITYFLESVNVK